MKITREGAHVKVALQGALGETSPFFTMPVKDVLTIDVDMSEFTFINSIGVKNWIMWTLRLPQNCVVRLHNCPLVIASQASMVMGFATPKITLESLRLPYVCDSCSVETVRLVKRGEDYEYAAKDKPAQINIPMEVPCAKCGTGKMEPDLLIGKTFKFLG
jgi:hypothetical protein